MTLFENVVAILLVIAPCIGMLGKWLDKKITSREKDKYSFDCLILRGIKSIGALTAANTAAIKNGVAGQDMEVALVDYNLFLADFEKFKNQQTAKAL